MASNNDLSLKSPFIRLTGTGDIDVGASQMNYVAKAAVVTTSEGQGGADLAHLKGLSIPVRLYGPFDALNYKIEWSTMLKDAAKGKVDEKVKEVEKKAKDAVKDQAKNALKGLFGK